MKNAVNLLKKEHKRYLSFLCRRSDPYGSRDNTEPYWAQIDPVVGAPLTPNKQTEP